MAFDVRIGAQGRIVLPADVRKKLGIHTGEELVGHIENDRLFLETRVTALNRLQKRFARKPGEPSEVDALIKERRKEAKREAEED